MSRRRSEPPPRASHSRAAAALADAPRSLTQHALAVQNIVRMRTETGVEFSPQAVDLTTATNVMDRWIQAATRELVNTVREQMDLYHLYNVVPFLVKFIDDLTNIYVRYNRRRLKGRDGPEDCALALATLFDTLHKVRAPCLAAACHDRSEPVHLLRQRASTSSACAHSRDSTPMPRLSCLHSRVSTHVCQVPCLGSRVLSESQLCMTTYRVLFTPPACPPLRLLHLTPALPCRSTA